jgi:plasmid rolling circle replication initiator protein Rep
LLFSCKTSLAEKFPRVNTLIDGTGEILQDFKDGKKEKPWKEKKVLVEKLEELFRIAKEGDPCVISDSGLYSLSHCGSYLTFNHCPNHSEEKRLIRADFCKNRLCPMCNWRKSLKMYGQMTEIVEKMTTDRADLRFIFLTLTVKNPEGQDLSATIDAMNEGFKLLVDKSKNLAASKAVKKNILGWFKSLEITYNAKDDTYHPHFHVVLAVPDSYFTRGFTTTAKWVKLWRACMKLDYDPIVHTQSADMSQKGALCEITKYATKGEYLMNCPDQQAAAAVAVLANSLRNRRLVGFGGIFRDVRKFLKQDDIEDGDLVHVAGDDPEGDTCKICGAKMLEHLYTWRMGAYIC